MQVAANGITLEVESHGEAGAPALILIRGLGTQLVHWPANLITGLVGEGLRVITFDNRDTGLSARCPAPGDAQAPEAIRAALAQGRMPPAAYTLDDMARDVVGLMDALGLARAHVFGISMGGAIVQLLALDHPGRLLSATIVMSAARPLVTPNNIDLLLAHPETPRMAEDNWVAAHARFGSPGYPMDEAAIRTEAARAYARGADHRGVNRQLLALMAARDRRDDLGALTLPCLVLHGRDDRLVAPALGAEIAGLIPGAAHEEIAGMGHIITPALAPLIQARLMAFIRGL